MRIFAALLVSTLSLVFLIIPLASAGPSSSLLFPAQANPAQLGKSSSAEMSARGPTPLPLPTAEPTPAPSVVQADTYVSPTPGPELSWEEIFNLSLGTDDADCDGIKNIRDNCPLTFNPNQTDTNKNGTGDVCDAALGNESKVDAHCDIDQDGIFDKDDNCPLVCNPDQKDKNKNAVGDVCDPDLLREWVRINPCPKPRKKKNCSAHNDKSRQKLK
jgi:hypothetical protein